MAKWSLEKLEKLVGIIGILGGGAWTALLDLKNPETSYIIGFGKCCYHLMVTQTPIGITVAVGVVLFLIGRFAIRRPALPSTNTTSNFPGPLTLPQAENFLREAPMREVDREKAMRWLSEDLARFDGLYDRKKGTGFPGWVQEDITYLIVTFRRAITGHSEPGGDFRKSMMEAITDRDHGAIDDRKLMLKLEGITRRLRDEWESGRMGNGHAS